jgi:hypothetical protein
MIKLLWHSQPNSTFIIVFIASDEYNTFCFRKIIKVNLLQVFLHTRTIPS